MFYNFQISSQVFCILRISKGQCPEGPGRAGIDPAVFPSLLITRRNRDKEGDGTHKHNRPALTIPGWHQVAKRKPKELVLLNPNLKSYTQMLLFPFTSGSLILPKQVQHCHTLGDTQDFKQEALSFKKYDVRRTFQLDFFSTKKAYSCNFWISFLTFPLEAYFSFCSSIVNFGLFYIGQEQIGHITEIAENASSYFNLFIE